MPTLTWSSWISCCYRLGLRSSSGKPLKMLKPRLVLGIPVELTRSKGIRKRRRGRVLVLWADTSEVIQGLRPLVHRLGLVLYIAVLRGFREIGNCLLKARLRTFAIVRQQADPLFALRVPEAQQSNVIASPRLRKFREEFNRFVVVFAAPRLSIRRRTDRSSDALMSASVREKCLTASRIVCSCGSV